MIKFVFFGTPDYVLPVLTKLNRSFREKSEHATVAVVTQPPRPVGRKQIRTYSPVDKWAHERKIPIFYSAHGFEESGIKADIGILASYGEIVPKSVIDYFSKGILNVHPSLLPKFRGASPVQATIIAGETPGVTIIKLDKELDHGNVVGGFKDELLEKDTTETLRNRLFARSGELLVDLVPAYMANKINVKQQDHTKATFTHKVRKNDAFIPFEAVEAVLQGLPFKGEWELPFIKVPKGKNGEMETYKTSFTPENIERFIRAMQPWPICWTRVQQGIRNKEQGTQRMKILKAHVEPIAQQRTKNKEQKTSKAASRLVLDEVQMEGKNPTSWNSVIKIQQGE